MKRFFIFFALAISACAPSSNIYWDKPIKGAVVVYRPSATLVGTGARVKIKVDGKSVCDLAHGGFVVINASKHDVTISASHWGINGETEIQAQVGDYIRVEYNNEKLWVDGIGGAILEGVTGGKRSPFILTKQKTDAEVVGLRQDCV